MQANDCSSATNRPEVSRLKLRAGSAQIQTPPRQGQCDGRLAQFNQTSRGFERRATNSIKPRPASCSRPRRGGAARFNSNRLTYELRLTTATTCDKAKQAQPRQH